MTEFKIIKCDNGGYFVTIDIGIESRFYCKDENDLKKNIAMKMDSLYETELPDIPEGALSHPESDGGELSLADVPPPPPPQYPDGKIITIKTKDKNIFENIHVPVLIQIILDKTNELVKAWNKYEGLCGEVMKPLEWLSKNVPNVLK